MTTIPASPSSFEPPPHGLRLVTLHDRLVVHDITFALRRRTRSSSPSASALPAVNRNALIDAANSIPSSPLSPSRHHHHRPRLVDLPSPDAPTNSSDDRHPHHHRYLVFPFATAHAPCDPPQPYECATPEAAGLIPQATNNSYPGDVGGLSSRHNNAMMHHQTAPPKVDAVAAFIGSISLHSAVYVIVATQIRHVATLPCGPVLAVTKVSLLPLLSTSHAHLQGAAATAAAATTTSSSIASGAGASISKEDRDATVAIAKLLESGSLYYSVDTDLCRPYGWSTNVPSSYSADANNNQSNMDHHQFQWNFPLLSRLPPTVHSWAPPCIYGFVSEHHMSLSSSSMTANDHYPSSSFHMALVSRRSRCRAGTRFITRGVDAMGDVANFVETEQLVWPANDIHNNSNNMLSSSFTIIRGSIPVFWRQNNGIARPAPELDAGLVASRRAFALHFDALRNTYGDVCAVSLVNKHGAEGMLAQAFDRHHQLYCCYSSAPSSSTSGEADDDGHDNEQKPSLVAFDFHAYCAGKEYERGLSLLMNRLQSDVQGMGFNVFDKNGDSHSTTRFDHPGATTRTRTQTGVFRVNCVDCLDRTNVVQTMICREILQAQLQAVVTRQGTSLSEIRLSPESEDRFKHVWGDHADAISKQYSGTGALKTDFTRTGKRSTTGVIGDGVKSVMRMYYKNFVDEGRQEVIDMVCGNAVIRQQVSFGSSFPSTVNKKNGNADIDTRYSHRRRSATDHHIIDNDMTKKKSTGSGNNSNSKPATQSSLWYSFDAMRINAGGDKQAVMVELHDNVMYVTTSDGLCFEYPRHALVSWDKALDGDGRGGGASSGGSGGVSGGSGGGAVGGALSSDRRGLPSRLRLIYRGSYASPASAMPLDLLFRGGGGSGGGGMTARENFLRALLSWAAPPCTRLMSTRTSLRVRVLVATDGIGEHLLSDWGLGEPPRTRRGNNSFHRNSSRWSSVDASDDLGRRSYEDVYGGGVDDDGDDGAGARHEIVFLIIPNVSAASRGCGLAAVPNDVGDVRFHEAPSSSSPSSPSSKCRHLVLISAFALSERGPAIAVLASPAVAPTVMGVEEATWLSSTSSYSSSFGTSQHRNALNHGQPQHSFAQNGVAAVALQACGTSICVVAARLSSRAQVYAALMELRLGKSGYDLTAQYEHFAMTGLMGDNPWSLPSASLSASTYDASSLSSSHGAQLPGQPERPRRQWMQLDDGSLCHALTNGVSVRRHSLPTLRYDDLLFQQQQQKHQEQQQQQQHNPSPFVCCVCDGVVDGKPSPALPKRLCRAVVTVSQLHAENVKIPRGVESSSQMNCSIVLSCALATTDMVTTRPTLRPTTFPDWSDVLTLQMTPSDVDDVMRAFLFGQVVVPNVLGDPFVAGSFVVPLATAPSGFDVRCRLGGHVTARLVGHVDVDTAGGVSGGGNGDGVESYQQYNNDDNRWSNERQNSSHNRHSNELSKTQSSSMSTMSARAAEYAAGLNQLALKKSSGIAMDDVNQRIEQARKKGARQMKSAFNKLSALMSASSLSSSASSPPFSAAGAGAASLSSSSSSMNNARGTTNHMTSMPFQQQQEHQPGNQHQAFQQRHGNTAYVTRAEQGGRDEILQQHQQYAPATATAAAAVGTRTPQQAQRQMQTRTRATPCQADESGGLQRPDITSTRVQSGGARSAAAASYAVDVGDGNRYSSSVTSTFPMRTPKSPSSVTTRRVASPGVGIITGGNITLPSKSTTADAGHHASTTVSDGAGADALLLGLAETKTLHRQSSASSSTVAATCNAATSVTGSAHARHADLVPLHVSSSSTTHDPLLSGLAAQKQKNAPQVSADDDDGWGDFTSA